MLSNVTERGGKKKRKRNEERAKSQTTSNRRNLSWSERLKSLCDKNFKVKTNTIRGENNHFTHFPLRPVLCICSSFFLIVTIETGNNLITVQGGRVCVRACVCE